LITDSGRLDIEVEKRITNASKAFRALRHAVFDNSHLPLWLRDKCMELVYYPCCCMVESVGYHLRNI